MMCHTNLLLYLPCKEGLGWNNYFVGLEVYDLYYFVDSTFSIDDKLERREETYYRTKYSTQWRRMFIVSTVKKA